ncbi:MAG: hypothetical protein K6G18_15175 [Treponema sp.]|nr:hypothetical protein [Treponema sp.]
MKKIVLSFLFLIVYASAYSQITTREVKKTKNTSNTQMSEKSSEKYDGSVNFLTENANRYIGETLYVKGKTESLRKHGYENFTKNYKNYLKRTLTEYADYDALAEKYFVVEDVFDYEINRKAHTFLKLKEKETKEIWYFDYDYRYEFQFPFIAVKHFEFLKEEYIGKKFVVRGRNWISSKEPMKDLNTGEIAKEVEAGNIWTCVDVSVEQEFYTLALILQNSLGQEVALGVKQLKGNYFIFTEDEVNSLKTKYGEKHCQSILEGKVNLGMTREECELSWGKPKDINRTTNKYGTSEQWVYSDNYLYFDNGILKAIQ